MTYAVRRDPFARGEYERRRMSSARHYQLAAYCLQCAELSPTKTLELAWRKLARAHLNRTLGTECGWRL